MKKQKGDLRLLFWNVQDWHLRNGETTARERFDRILAVLRREKPDIALFAEVTDPKVKTEIAMALPGHTVFATTARSSHRLMAVFNHAATQSSVVIEQRDEFVTGPQAERSFPMVRIIGRDFNIAVLAAHTKSGSDPESLAQRQRTMGQVLTLHAALAQDNTPLVVMGDLNTMGNSATVDSAREIEIMRQMMAAEGLTLLPKDTAHTWHGVDHDARYPDCDLDHAIVTTNIAHRVRPTAGGAAVRVGGWPDADTLRKRNGWVRRHSDHAYLVMDIAPA